MKVSQLCKEFNCGMTMPAEIYLENIQIYKFFESFHKNLSFRFLQWPFLFANKISFESCSVLFGQQVPRNEMQCWSNLVRVWPSLSTLSIFADIWHFALIFNCWKFTKLQKTQCKSYINVKISTNIRNIQ